jgi:hypothetical protein
VSRTWFDRLLGRPAHVQVRGLSAGEYMDRVFVLYVREFLGMYDIPFQARERAMDTFLTPEQLRRKQNAEVLKKMGILPA